MSELLDKDKLWLKLVVNIGDIDECYVSEYLNHLLEGFKSWFDESIQFITLPFRGESDDPSNVEVLYDPKGNADENIKRVKEAECLLEEFTGRALSTARKRCKSPQPTADEPRKPLNL
ncbi:MAG: hypothetical protein J6X18_10865 [Bacteroidales bacterium]|nr:hypothetical protein [Bacteroidales bacterium]